ncbi:MAG: nitrogen regulation protein NR(I) [Pseudomonadota bacterium]
MDGTVLLADDDRAIRTVLSQALTRAGCRVRSTGSASTLWRWVEEGEGDVVVSDVMMPDGDALDLLPAIKRKRPDLPVIVMSAQNTVMTAIRAAEAGAYEYLPKPFDLKEVLEQVRKGLSQRRGAPQPARGTVEEPVREENLPLIGRSPPMQEVYRIMARLMNTDLSVMITGESGTGKELVARALHNFGHRKNGPFVAVNMAAIPRELIEAELFGTEPGAGQGEPVVGRFELAAGGTLFLDEVGDMPPDAQTRLLRVLQDGEFTRVGGRAPISANVRIVSATHQDLKNLIVEGKFREDLFYRLNVVPVRLPPLRDRLEDVPDLTRAFLARAESEGLPRKRITQDAFEVLKRQTWAGNVRELENLMRRLAVLVPDEVISAREVEQEIAARPASAMEQSVPPTQKLSQAVEAHLQRYFSLHGNDLPPPGLYDRIIREVEMPLIALSLAATRGNQVKTAELLGINRNTLRKKIRDLDIPVTRGKTLM